MRYVTISGFSGINRQVSPFYVAEGELADVENFVTDKIGILKKTGDYQIKGSQIAAGQDILGGIDFYRNNGTHTHIVACDGSTNADIYEYSGGSWTAASQSLTAGAKVRFAYSPTLDYLFAVNYSDATRSYDGTTWSTTTNVNGAPKAKFVINFGRRMYLLNCDVSGTAYPSRAYRSSLVDSGSITWDTTNDWIVFDDVITGAGKNGENMLVGCENSVWIFTLADQKYQVSTHGVVSHESIASYGRWTFWAARDGVYAFDGSEDQKISLPIQDYWDGISETNLANIQAEVLGHHLHIYIGDITSPETMNNVLFDYDILQNDWNRIKLGEECKNLHTYVNSSGKRLFMGNDDGEVFELFTSGAQNNSAFASSFETNWIYGSGKRIVDDYYELWGFGDKLSGISIYYKVDDGDWEPAGELNGSTDVVKFKARGYRIKFKGQEISKNNMFEIHALEVGYEPAYAETEDKEK